MPEQVTLTTEQLTLMMQTAIKTAIEESRKPLPPTDAQRAETERRQESRRRVAESVKQEQNMKRQIQMACSHEHSKRDGGGSFGVYIMESGPGTAGSPGYVLCQRCQGRFRPGEFTTDRNQPVWLRDSGAIYDTDKFNKLFQDCSDSGLMG